MLNSTERLLDLGMGEQVFKDWNLASIFGGTPARCHALVNKALKKQEIVRLCRGSYILGAKYRTKMLSQFFIANRIVTGSVISLESALSFHGWIPENVPVTISVISKGRTRSFVTPVGEFEYIKIPFNPYEFLSGVVRKEINSKPFLIATPLRALADYVYHKKIEWSGLDFLLSGLRIEMDFLESLTSHHFDTVLPVYHSKRVLYFLQQLRQTLEL